MIWRVTHAQQSYKILICVVLLSLFISTLGASQRRRDRDRKNQRDHADSLPRPLKAASSEDLGDSEDCNWEDDWREWTTCNKRCGIGSRVRSKNCMCKGRPSDPDSCPQPAPMQAQDCNTEDCCEWQGYTGWTNCSKSCGGGRKTKSQICFCPDYAIEYGFNPVNACRGDPQVVETICNDKDCCQWVFGEWSECTTYCGGATKTRTQECKCSDDSDNNQCSGEPGTDEAPCETDQVTCPQNVDYWKAHHRYRDRYDDLRTAWEVPENTKFKCNDHKYNEDYEKQTWLDILKDGEEDPWSVLAQQFIAAKLSIASGSYGSESIDDALDEAEHLIAECTHLEDDKDKTARAKQLADILEKYTNAQITLGNDDPEGGQGALPTLNTEVSQSSGLAGGGQEGGSVGTGGQPELTAFFVAVPTVTIVLITLAVALTVYVVRQRFQKALASSDQDLLELQAQIDKRNQEESGDDVDVDELEELKL